MTLIGFVLYILGEIKDISEEVKRISAYVSDTKILQELLKNDKK